MTLKWDISLFTSTNRAEMGHVQEREEGRLLDRKREMQEILDTVP